MERKQAVQYSTPLCLFLGVEKWCLLPTFSLEMEVEESRTPRNTGALYW
jgi:hypothetical protein